MVANTLSVLIHVLFVQVQAHVQVCGKSLDELNVSLSAQWTRGSGCDDGVTSPGTGQGSATSVSRHATLHLLFSLGDHDKSNSFP